MAALLNTVLALLAAAELAAPPCRAARAPLWFRGSAPTEQALAMAGILSEAPAVGLRAEDYDAALWAARLPEAPVLEECDLDALEVAFTAAVARYVSDVVRGRIDPRTLGVDLGPERATLDVDAMVRRLAEAPDVRAVLSSFQLPLPMYQRTLQTLRHYRELGRIDDGEPLVATKLPVEPGETWEGVPRLARLLRVVGDLAPDAPAGDRYDGELIPALRRFQLRHGLEDDGRIGRRTLAELNTPLARRVTQLELTLERLRWLPAAAGGPAIVVNVPGFQLRATVAGRTVLSMKVVVGRAFRHETPLFASMLQDVVFRPYWSVPPGILRDEILPELRRRPAFFEARGYEIVDRLGHVVLETAPDPATTAKLRDGRLVLRQRPGPRNPLGTVKFVLPNRHGVYLHGTPSRELFDRSRRDFSHGCIRVEDPAALAAWALRDDAAWTEDRIRAAMEGGATVRVRLARPIPVLIVYGTAVVTESGEVLFFDDLYGEDAALERALAARSRPAAAG